MNSFLSYHRPKETDGVGPTRIRSISTHRAGGHMLRSTPESLRALRHVGLIPDGARRWAVREDVTLSDAYDVAFCKVADVARLCFGRGASVLSVYALSAFNLVRQPDEIEALATSLGRFASEGLGELAEEADAQVRLVGDSVVLPPCIQEAREMLSAVGCSGGCRVINLLLGYSAAFELHEAMASTRADGIPILEALLVPDAVDLVIRSGGARVLSDFLPLQSAYAQIAFIPDLWNDMPLAQFEGLVDRARCLRPLFGE